MTTTAFAPTYVANVVDTAGRWHEVRFTATSSASAKATARRVAKAQGIAVKFVNDFFITSA